VDVAAGTVWITVDCGTETTTEPLSLAACPTPNPIAAAAKATRAIAGADRRAASDRSSSVPSSARARARAAAKVGESLERRETDRPCGVTTGKRYTRPARVPPGLVPLVTGWYLGGTWVVMIRTIRRIRTQEVETEWRC
jgi:hypothetical protein